MNFNKNIFDSYQKSLIDKDYVDLDNLDNIDYLDNDEDVKPMTAEQYVEMEGSIGSSLSSTNKYETSEGLIESIFSSSSQTFTSFTNSVNKLMNEYSSTNDTNFDFTNGQNLLFVENAVSTLVGDIDPTDAVLGDVFNTLSDVVSLIPSVTSLLLTTAQAAMEISASTVEIGIGGFSGIISSQVGFMGNVWSGLTGNGFGDIFGDIADDFSSGYDVGSSLASDIVDPITDLMNSAISMGQVAVTNYSNWLSSALSLMSDTFTNVYTDGVTETKFGQKMEQSWKIFVANNTGNIDFNTISNPLSNLGTDPILFGAPPRYTPISDPRDRAYMNTFIRDGNILSIIPGKPRYNGLSLGKIDTEKDSNNVLSNVSSALSTASSAFSSIIGDLGSNLTDLSKISTPNSETDYQTTSSEYAEIALDYLKRNGISDVFNENDKRYYTFEQDYKNYYSYLETMLNTIYTRMGLGESKSEKSELFSFFRNMGTDQESLLEKFNGKSLGFYFEGNPAVSEYVSNDTNDPANLKATADAMSDEFQRQNYITGFGTNSSRKAGIASARISKGVEAISDILGSSTSKTPFSSLSSSLGSAGTALSGLSSFGDKMMGALTYTSNMDLNAITESMLSTNGMKTVFPNLWTDSNYAKSINVEFEFISPYGDPLSIFQYVYTPLCSLLALALPKQAEENGYVNPFFLRMDIPGVISSDFAIISNITWVRGGANNLWTVDKHPRAVTVSVTFEDLYQFLAMTKRVSYLSANPNFSMFLDSFSGIRSLYTEGNFINNDYWNLLVNRLNTNNTYSSSLWNQTEMDRAIHSYLYPDAVDEQQYFFNNYYKRDISWMKNK